MPELVSIIACASVAPDIFMNRWSYLMVVDIVTPFAETNVSDSEKQYMLEPMTICATFWRLKEDTDQEYELKLVMLAPDGRETDLEPPMTFVLESSVHRVLQRTNFIMCRLLGDYRIRIELRKAGRDAEWTPIGTYSFKVQSNSLLNSTQEM